MLCSCMCTDIVIKVMLNHYSLQLYHLSKRLLGEWMTEKLLRASVLSQFAGGVNEAESEVVVRKLASHGISSIWFYSDEKDLG